MFQNTSSTAIAYPPLFIGHVHRDELPDQKPVTQ